LKFTDLFTKQWKWFRRKAMSATGGDHETLPTTTRKTKTEILQNLCT
jgi:hypothetical protein